MGYILYGFLGLMLALLWLQNDTLQDELKEQHELNKIAIEANNRWESEVSKLNSEFAKGLQTLSELKQERQKEIKYVTKVKESIIHNNDSSCIDAVNSVYARLLEQRNDNNSTYR
ncbi:hypothetical protein [Campylobacter vicugnae]|uniref:hypothetical protein n=1 Tax=Campylobacter vicugnae TaxID=1660076 RepID=UPI00254CB173|nr:hypothetical protein [Campylobacter ovis]MDL0105223.1 hypothetical protein [Campylobacter ovis]MDL0106642.1 hypothetical protein [Campylobacter ovis]